MTAPPTPTAEQCSAGAAVTWGGRRGFCCWYPQMGGYVGFCVVEPLGETGCFEAWVWHDGEFPFSAGRPVNLHHCSPEQFIQFGQLVKEKSVELAAQGKEG